ncbi:hypothetical protein K1719_036242 [Acacia pycnantha]|nr:hypothetical protein K1719_036242 [Acacia pycnantha]
MRATAMSLTGTWNHYTRSRHKQKCPLCDLMKNVNYFTCPLILVEESGDLYRCSRPDTPPDRIYSLTPVKNKAYSVSFYLCANGSLVSWFLMMADSSISWSKNANLFSIFRLDAAKHVHFPEITIPKAQKILKNEKAALCAQIGSPLSFSGNSAHSYACSSENPLSSKRGSSPEVSDLDKASYWHSLFNLQSEDVEWISDFKASSPFSTKSNSSIDSSDLEGVTFFDSLLSLEEKEDLEWFSGSKAELEYFDSPNLCCNSQGDPELLLQTYTEQVIADEPLFWPFQEDFKCDSEECWNSFCISPRKHINLLGTPAKSSASKLKPRKGCSKGLVLGKQNSDEAECRSRSETSRRTTLFTSSSAKRVPRAGNNSTRKDIVLNRFVAWERGYFALHRQLPIEKLVGLEEFDGHEGLDSEFNGDFLILDE